MGTERWEAVMARVADLGRAHVRAGVVGSKAHEQHAGTSLTNAELALIHEFGTSKIPERSFVRSTLRDPAVRAELERLMARISRAVIEGKMSRDRGLGLLGAFVAGKIRERIVNHEIRPEDAPATVAGKGHDVPLLDGGELAAAVAWDVVK